MISNILGREKSFIEYVLWSNIVVLVWREICPPYKDILATYNSSLVCPEDNKLALLSMTPSMTQYSIDSEILSLQMQSFQRCRDALL